LDGNADEAESVQVASFLGVNNGMGKIQKVQAKKVPGVDKKWTNNLLPLRQPQKNKA
jgi:hypothetical protein